VGGLMHKHEWEMDYWEPFAQCKAKGCVDNILDRDEIERRLNTTLAHWRVMMPNGDEHYPTPPLWQQVRDLMKRYNRQLEKNHSLREEIKRLEEEKTALNMLALSLLREDDDE